MTDRELMQMALDAATEELPKVDERETVFCSIQGHHLRALCEFVRAALAQPEPDDGYCQACDGNHCTAKDGCVARDNPPPQREWQGLTDEEIKKEQHHIDWTSAHTYAKFARAIEAKLKEKNT